MHKIEPHRISHPSLVSFVAGLLIGAFAAASPATAQQSTSDVVRAADKFLATLTDTQRQKVLYAYDDAGQRARWSNFPTGMLPRGGMRLKDMSPEQRTAVLDLLKTVLSPMGYEKVNQIRMADDAFASGSGRGPRAGGPSPGGPFGFGRRPFGGGDMFGSNLYYISFLGKPSATTPWMLQFGGHHLALNITISGLQGVMTPSLTGAQPASFTSNGQTIRPVGRESDKAYALLQSLDPNQRKQTILSYRVADLVLGPGQDGKRITPEGLKVASMNDKQKAMLLDLIAEWAGIMNTSAASARMAQLKAELNDTWFAWSGATSVQPGTNISAYYRIQGPHLVIEYAPQNDEPTNHVHTIYRDPTNDYGARFAATK